MVFSLRDKREDQSLQILLTISIYIARDEISQPRISCEIPQGYEVVQCHGR